MAAHSVAPKPRSVAPPHDQAQPRDESVSHVKVLSVSPHGVASDGAAGPRALPDVADDIIHNLTELIDLATQASARLERAVTTRGDHDRRATRASLHLQERLRLGARMLQAFQDQLTRAEQTLINLRSAQSQMQSAADEAVAKLKQQMSHLSGSAGDDKHIDLAELDRRIDALREALDQIASNMPRGMAPSPSIHDSPQIEAPIVEVKSLPETDDVEGPFRFRKPTRRAAR